MSQAPIEDAASSMGVASRDDDFAQVLGLEPYGRVRGLGSGVTPTRVFGSSNGLNGVTFTTSSTELDKLENQMNAKFNIFFTEIKHMNKIVGSSTVDTNDDEQVSFFIKLPH